MIEVYLYGCMCGKNGAMIRRVRRYAQLHFIDLTIYHTKYDHDSRQEHARLLTKQELSLDGYEPLVIYNNEVMRLKEWNL